jgi:type III secretion protein L
MAIGKVIKGDPTADAERSPADRPAAARPRGVMNAEDFEARQTAQSIIAAAQKQAADIVADARAREQQFIAQGRELGRQEVLAQAGEVVARAHLQRDEMLSRAKGEILELALKVAEKIIGKDLERQPSVIVEVCATAIEYVRQAKAMVLRVNPRDALVLRERHKDLLERVGQLAAISIKEDPEVGRGGCIIQTDGGTTDAQLSTQLEMLRQLLLNADEPERGEEGPE